MREIHAGTGPPTIGRPWGAADLGVNLAVALLILAGAWLIRWLLDPLLDNNHPFVTFFPAVVLAGYWCGAWGASLGAILGGLSVWCFFMPQRGLLHSAQPADLAGFALYALGSMLIIGVSARLQGLQRAAHDRAERLRATLLSIGDAVITTDARGYVTALNPTAEQLTGWPQADAAGRRLEEVFRIANELTGEPAPNPVYRVLAEGKAVGLANHTALIARGGQTLPIDDSAAPIVDMRGRISGVVLVFRDITERRRTEEALRRSEHQLADFFENAGVGISWLSPEGTILKVNQAELDLLGLSREECAGRDLRAFVDSSVVDDLLRRLMNGDRIKDQALQVRRKDGTWREVMIDASGFWEHGRLLHARCFMRDMTDRNRADLVSRQLAAIVESSDDAIVSKDLKGIVRSWNAGAERMFGYSAAEMLGESILKLIPPERQSEEPEILEGLSRGERIDHYETVRRRKDGTLIDISLTVSPVRGPDGAVIGASKIARDITDRVRADAERQALLDSERAARARAEAATRMRDEFLAVVSHELRTPLNGILGWAQLLKRGNLDAASLSEGLAAIERGARTQAQLIEDLLDMNRIMTGKLHLEISTVDLPPVIEAAVATLRPAAEAKGLRLHLALDTGVGPIKGDPTRLQQVVWNLVSNAVKFTGRGGQVQVVLERVNSHVQITVADTGVGIAPDFLPHVFERFSQADASTTRRHGGLGLGLAIARQIVELHGGTIRADSAGEGEGATFTVRLPVAITRARVAQDANVAPTLPGEDNTLEGVRVLVVDDDADAAEVVKRILAAHRAEVTAVNSAAQALSCVLDFAPNVILSDIGMPEMDGYELIREIRSAGISSPAVAVTAFARAEDRIRTLQAGYSMHLPKPIEATELLTVVQAVLRNTGRRAG